MTAIAKLDITNGLKIKHVTEVLNESIAVIKRRQTGEKFGYITRWKRTNEHLGGSLAFGSNFILGARPGVGKSAYVNILAFDILELNKEIPTIILYWNFEMPAYRQGIRLFSNKIKLSVNELLSSQVALQEEHVERLIMIKNTFADKNLFFINIPVNSKKFYETIEQVQMKYPKHRIVNIMDHTRLIKADNEPKEEEKLFNLMALANEAKLKMGVTNIFLSQLNRNIESNDRRKDYFKPMVSDLFGSDKHNLYICVKFTQYATAQTPNFTTHR